MKKIIGQTKDVGFQFGTRKTIPVSTEEVWTLLFSKEGLNIWLGRIKNELEIEKEYETESGITGFIRVLKPYSHIRLNWKPKNWKNISTVQIRVIGNQDKATIAIHQEKLLNSEQRDEMKEHWNKVMARLIKKMNKASR